MLKKRRDGSSLLPALLISFPTTSISMGHAERLGNKKGQKRQELYISMASRTTTNLELEVRFLFFFDSILWAGNQTWPLNRRDNQC